MKVFENWKTKSPLERFIRIQRTKIVWKVRNCIIHQNFEIVHMKRFEQTMVMVHIFYLLNNLLAIIHKQIDN